MKAKIEFLQCGRALAALAVVLHHTGALSDQFGFAPPALIKPWLANGRLGVDFFFVLSGYIIHSIHRRDPPGRASAGVYLRKRIIRIFTPYLPVSVAMMALYSLAPSMSAAGRDWSALTSLTLIPSERPPALAVAWTLSHEMAFYIIFLGMFFSRYFYAALALWGVIMLAFIVGPTAIAMPADSFFVSTSIAEAVVKLLFNPINLEFLMGVAASWIIANTTWSAWPFAIAGIAAAILYFPLAAPLGYSVVFGLAMALFTIGMTRLELSGGIAFPNWLVLLGDASYALYLLHYPIVSALARAPWPNWYAFAAACTLASIAAAFAYHIGFERVALAHINRLLLAPKRRIAEAV